MKKIIEDSIKRIKQYPNKYSEVFSNICYGEGLSLYTKLGEFKKAEGLYEQRISYFKEGTMNWFRFKNLYLILNIHSKNYSKAFSLSNEIIHHPNFFKANTKTLRQRLFITRAFIEILVKAGKIRGVSSSMSSFKIPQFLKEVPTYRYDTGGFGFSVNIAEFIHNLIDKNYGKLIDKRESLITYTSKHLRSDGDFRSRHFLKMLIAVVSKDFYRLRVEAYVNSRRLLYKLKKKPLSKARQELSLEIIPFEDLWEIVLELLD